LQNSDYYRLEIPCEAGSKKFSALEIISVSLKIVALFLLLILFKYFYIAICVWIASIVVNFFKRNLVYKYVYTVSKGVLTVEKVFNYDKKILCEQVELSAAEIENGECGKKYYEISKEIPITVKSGGREFSVDVDEYFYAVTNLYVKGDTYDFLG